MTRSIHPNLVHIAEDSFRFSPRQVTVAQGIEEAGWSPSELATKHNNWFGIKYASLPKNRTHQTNGFVIYNGIKYASYVTLDDCGMDRQRILRSMGAGGRTVDAFIESFSHQWCPDSGFDSKAGYGNRLRKLIQENRFDRFDDEEGPASLETAIPGPIPKPAEVHQPTTNKSGENVSLVTSVAVVGRALNTIAGNPVTVALAKRAIDAAQEVEGVKELEKKGIEKFHEAVKRAMEHPEMVPILNRLPGFAQTMVVHYLESMIQGYVDTVNHAIQ